MSNERDKLKANFEKRKDWSRLNSQVVGGEVFPMANHEQIEFLKSEVAQFTESNRQLREELEKVKKDKQRLDKIELGTPNILYLCKFDHENMERLSGHLWEVGEKGIGYESLREAIDKYEISSGMDIDRTENAPASGDAPVPEITLALAAAKEALEELRVFVEPLLLSSQDKLIQNALARIAECEKGTT